MSVGEGAAFLLLSGREEDSPFAMAEVMGSGMSCDAYHPASPHPDGEGALKAMTAALKNAGITPAGIDYVNLHGTGTVENDRAEGRALFALFGSDLPFLSSTKGATGHALAASGAVEAVLSCIALSEGIVPGTVGCTSPDAEIPVTPLLSALQHPVRCVLSNSFGFGGNNAAIVLSQPRILPPPPDTPRAIRFEVIGHSCLTGVGSCQASKEALEKGQPITGAVPNDELVRSFPPREVRRLKRLPRMVLTLAHEAIDSCGGDNPPGAIIFGTSRGPLSETHDFLSKLFESGEQFPSPTDFVGSVHNSPAGLAAIHLKAHGPNITVTGGDRSFEDSLLAASLVACDCDGPLLLLCADEHHDHLTPVLDDKTVREDGGGGLLLKIPGEIPVSPLITFRQYMTESGGKSSLDVLVERELSSGDPSRHIGALFASDRAALMITQSGVSVPTLRISQITGTHAASAAAAVSLAVSWLAARKIPREGARSIELDGRAIAFVLDGAHSSFILLELP